jgi:hypothetical protein
MQLRHRAPGHGGALSIDPMRARENSDDVPKGLPGGDITVGACVWEPGLESAAPYVGPSQRSHHRRRGSLGEGMQADGLMSYGPNYADLFWLPLTVSKRFLSVVLPARSR